MLFAVESTNERAPVWECSVVKRAFSGGLMFQSVSPSNPPFLSSSTHWLWATVGVGVGVAEGDTCGVDVLVTVSVGVGVDIAVNVAVGRGVRVNEVRLMLARVLAGKHHFYEYRQ